MRIEDTLTFSLDNFEGPLPLLLHLIQRTEIDVYEISIFALGKQFLQLLEEKLTNIDQGAEFIAAQSFLLNLKSRALLPKEERSEEILEDDPHFDIIHHLLDYCRFKGAAEGLSALEKQQSLLHTRGIEPICSNRKHLGIEHLSLDDLAGLFQQMAAKMAPNFKTIEEEDWKVADKLETLTSLFVDIKTVSFAQLFNSVSSKLELIVTFLALLEMMKLGKLIVFKDPENTIWISMPEEGGEHRA